MVLAVSNFAQGLGAFAVIGAMAVLIADLYLTLDKAGLVVSLYAVVYAATSPVLVTWSGRFERRTVLASGLTLVALGAALGMLATDYPVVLAGRALMAVGGGLITPVSAAIGMATSEEASRGRVLATVFGGLTLSQALGLPVGAWLASVLGWRAIFGVVAATAATAAVLVLKRVPRNLSVQRSTLRALGSVFRDPCLLAAVAFIVFFIGANFTLVTYLPPFLTNRYGLSGGALAGVLVLYGIGAIAGNRLGGHLTDRLGPTRTLELLCAVHVAVLPALTLVRLPLALTIVLLGIWSLFAWSVHVAQQARLARLDPARAPILLALHSSAIYVGSSIGATLGGRVMEATSDRWLGPVGATQILLAAGSLWMVALMACAPDRTQASR